MNQSSASATFVETTGLPSFAATKAKMTQIVSIHTGLPIAAGTEEDRPDATVLLVPKTTSAQHFGCIVVCGLVCGIGIPTEEALHPIIHDQGFLKTAGAGKDSISGFELRQEGSLPRSYECFKFSKFRPDLLKKLFLTDVDLSVSQMKADEIDNDFQSFYCGRYDCLRGISESEMLESVALVPDGTKADKFFIAKFDVAVGLKPSRAS